MTPLTAHLQRRIAAGGPITIADYMAECLMHPEHGYYTSRDPFGQSGDFTTAPEISQMFGELLGLVLVQCWLDQGQPVRFILAELGPGRGTLMADILRVGKAAPGFLDAAEAWLIEASPLLLDRQRETLSETRVNWADSVDDLPDGPLFLVANEFFDALPIRQFQREGETWRERQVGVLDGALQLGLGGPVSRPDLAHRTDAKDGDIVEICPAAGPIISAIADRIARNGGSALIIDYGGWRSRGDTLQALRDHQPVPVLDHAGQADLTAHVDFEALANAAFTVSTTQMTPQGVFLERIGITARAQALAQRLSGEALTQHIAAHRRLTHPEEMGNLFKVLGLHPKGAAPPPGLTP